jgi:hypothetical protein
MNRLVIGLGAGECGEEDLKEYLCSIGVDCCYNVHRIPWYETKQHKEIMYDNLSILLKKTKGYCVGDVGHYWLPYVESLNEVWQDIRFICVKDDTEKVVKRFVDEYYNFWTNPVSEYWDSHLYDCDNGKYWPKFFWPKEKAIRTYIANYNNAAFWMSNDMPNFMFGDREKLLGTKAGRDVLKRFIWS